MRFLMLVKASEALPDMGSYNEQLTRAGVLLDLSGLQAHGARVKFSRGKAQVIDDQGLIAGYWLIQARSKEEAIEWAKRVPFQDGEIEICRLLELSNDVV